MIFEKAERIVIKIGSSILTDEEGDLKRDWIKKLCDDVSFLIKQGKEVIIVSSGSVAAGKSSIKFKKQKMKIEEKQAAAAYGQPLLIKEYSDALILSNQRCAQILLTLADIENRRRYLNARSTLDTLLENGIVPIVNENDAIATAKLKFGDNDRLSALVAQMTQADLLVILSDIEGLYTADPNLNKDAEFISVVEEIDEEIEALAGGATSSVGTGGMSTKVQAATIASESGCETVITSGKDQHAIRDLFMNNKRHTLFKAVDNPKTARQKWILNTLKTNGSVTIDEGAHNAILKGKSLLPVGITVVDGTFSRGDKISINNIKGEEIAIGITAYASTDLFRIIGKHTDEIESILGFSGREYAVYANDLVVLE